MPSERLNDFINRVEPLAERAEKYSTLFKRFNSLLQKCGKMEGKIDIEGVQGVHQSLHGLIVNVSFAGTDADAIEVRCSVELKNRNKRQVYSRHLPNPRKLSIEMLDDIHGDEVIQKLSSILEYRDIRRKFHKLTD